MNTTDPRKISPFGRNDQNLTLRAWRLGEIIFISLEIDPIFFAALTLTAAKTVAGIGGADEKAA
jgi:hypothetical protein